MGFIVTVLGSIGGLGGIFGGGLFGKIFGSILSFGFKSLMKPKKPSIPSIKDRGLTQSVRQAITYRDIVYGRIKKSGPVVWMEMTNNNKWLHMVIAIASHECEEIESVFIEENEVAWNKETGEVTDDKYQDDGKAHAYVWTKLGSDDQIAIPEFVDATEATSDDRFRGVCYAYCKLRWNSKIYSQVPNISFMVKGKKIFDPRTSLTRYSDNAALCILDYLLDSRLGANIDSANGWDPDDWADQADICDELVPLAGGGNEKRYTINGVVSTEFDPFSDNIPDMLTSCLGKHVYSGGKHKLLVGSYVTPTVTIEEKDILSDIEIPVKQSRQDLFNGVRGLFVSPENNWQSSDFPAVASDTFKEEDAGERIWADVELPFTISSAACQRIAKALLLQMRQQIVINMSVTLRKGFELQAGDTVMVTDEDMGWDSKPFEIKDWELDRDSTIGLSCKLTLREIAPNTYDWNSSEETEVDPAPNTNLPAPRDIDAPTNVTLDSSEDQLLVDGSNVISRIKVTWDTSPNAFVTDGGQIEIQFKKSNETDWSSYVGTIQGSRTQAFIHPVEDNVEYDVRVRFMNMLRSFSPWATVSDHLVIGKTAPPQDVDYFAFNQNGAFATFTWTGVSDVDLDSYQLRIGVPGDSTWSTAQVLANRIKVNTYTTAEIPKGRHTVFIKAKDTIGNFSDNAKSTTFTFNPAGYTVDDELTLAADGWANGTLEDMVYNAGSNTISPDSETFASEDVEGNPETTYKTGYYTWPEIDVGTDLDVRVSVSLNAKRQVGRTVPIEPQLFIQTRSESDVSGASTLDNQSIVTNEGTFSKTVRHHTGKLLIESNSLASDVDPFSEYCTDAASLCEYTSKEYDLGEDVKLFLELQTDQVLGPGETEGEPEVTALLRYKTAAGSYGDFEEFSNEEITARYFQIKLQTVPEEGKVVVRTATIDVDDFLPFTGVGEFPGTRYVRVKVKIGPDTGIAYLKDYTITVDS